MYKVCILTAGKGTRNAYKCNKSLLQVGSRLAIQHIIGKISFKTEIVIALGHQGETVEAMTSLLEPRQKMNFVTVDKYEGEGSGPGHSLLQCKDLLQCPFIFTSCDTIVLEKYPEPEENWMGVGLVEDTQPYLTTKLRGNHVVKLYDKARDVPTRLAFIGVAGVKDYKAFWDGLSHPSLVNGEHQVGDGLNALLHKKVLAIPFSWFDIGTTEEYEKTNRYFSQSLFS